MRAAFTSEDIASIRAALLAFFDADARPLPWRTTRDAYAVWISEIMSQQTRVEIVIPYYERWLQRFPDTATLADAPLDDVLKAWEGLGYYSRARNIHAAARLLRDRHQGALPRSFETLRGLPGIGEYTAGAVASIAFGARRPAVDGNVRRVLARLLDHPSPRPAWLRQTAGELVPADRPGDCNQALMELGATICSPRSPRCTRCPVATQCAARAAGTQEQRPVPRTTRSIPTIDVATAVIRDCDGRLLIVRRPDRGLLAGMWSFPGVEIAAGEDPALTAMATANALVDTLITAPCPLGTVAHVFSHRREIYHCFLFEAARHAIVRDGIAWITGSDTTFALPRAQHRIRSLAVADTNSHDHAGLPVDAGRDAPET